MARSPERREPPQASVADIKSEAISGTSSKSAQPLSPARSDKSSDSEGREVRQNLEETNLNAPPSADTLRKSNLPMADTNGIEALADPSTSGSESGRGRLRRKRSREDFEDEAEKPQEKKVLERHVRKKSRDVTSPKDSDADVQVTAKANTSVSRIDEQEGDESMLSVDDSDKVQNTSSDRLSTPEAVGTAGDASAIVSPKNKRTLAEAQSGDSTLIDGATEVSRDATRTAKEPDAKRPRDTDGADQTNQGKSKIPPGSGFANTSAASPFSSLSSTQPITSISGSGASHNAGASLPQTSDDKFKASGFGSFAASSASPFGGISKTSSSSPFGAAAGGAKVTSFASSTSTSSSLGSGFGALGASTNKSTTFGGIPNVTGGGSVFGGALGASSFGNIGASGAGLKGFGTPGAQTITGLKQKAPRAFGAQADDQSDDEEEDGNDDDEPTAEDEPDKTKSNSDQEKRQAFQPTEVETGEEGEEAHWVGRAKLYTMDGQGNNRGWHERGVGPFKLNVTKEPPTRARFVLRADGTHRLLLNAAVTRNLTFGDADGKKPLEGRLLFNAPTPEGKLEMHLLRMKADKAVELWDKVERVKNLLL